MVQPPSSPVYDGDFPDPFVLTVGDRYYAYGTQTGDVNVQVMESPDLARWEHRGDALPELPPWAAPGRTWAPAVVMRDGSAVLYYAVFHEEAGRQCISVATADDPAGPFVDRSAGPLIFQAELGGSIDPSPFVDTDGAAYLLWKSDDNAAGYTPSLWGAPLDADGHGLAGEPVELLQAGAAWEKPLIEAPSLVWVGDLYVLFYSGGWWESDNYAIGYATGAGPLGPFERATETGPWLASGPGMAGPGGAEVFTDAGGDRRIAFHAWPSAVGYDNGGVRALWIEPLGFEDGQPRLG